jgi:hypothetical protein
VDFAEVEKCFDELNEKAYARMQYFAKQLSAKMNGARSDFAYYSVIRKSRFKKAISYVAYSRRNESMIFRDIRIRKINVYKLLASSLCSTLLFSIYNPRDDDSLDRDLLNKLMQHYHFLKKNKNVNIQEYVWNEKSRYYYSSRYQDIMMQAVEAKPELVSQILRTEAGLLRTYLFEACVRTNSMVQA